MLIIHKEESVELILYSSAINRSFNIFVLDMWEQIRIYDIEKKIIQLSGYSIKNKENPMGDIVIKTTLLLEGEKISEELNLRKNLKKNFSSKNSYL